MSDSVFANGMSIACKVSSGKSIAAMPDVCLSPPSPPAGPIPIPYPNTASASDTSDGSKTVQIGGKEVMLKDKSVFKTSSGNEAATKSFGMSVITHQIQGKAAFVAWSMDVKFEGQNVPRHLDLMGHNEASLPSGTVPFSFFSKMTFPVPQAKCAHPKWIMVEPAMAYTAQQKKDRLRKTNLKGDIAEADAADHNGVKDGNDMSGQNQASKIMQICADCGKLGGDIDHVTTDPSGKTSLVEVKNARNVDVPQLERRLELAKSLGCSVTAKLTGPHAAANQAFIQSVPSLSNVNIIVF